VNNVIISKDEALDHLRRIMPALREKYGVTKIGLFGSVARNEAVPESDIDIVIEMSEPRLFFMVHIKELLEKDFGKPVDVIRYRSKMNAYLKARIDCEAVYA